MTASMLDHMFSPRSIAVVGASRDTRKVGSMLLSNLLASGYDGRLTVVNPGASDVMGVPSVSSLLEIEGEIDLVIIAVPSNVVKSVLLDAEAKGAKTTVVISAGFREEGAEGRLLEEELSEIIKRSGMRAVGPNCFGIMDSQTKMNATFTSLWPGSGNIALISQSGAVGSTVLDWLIKMRVGLSRFASLGNKMDVDEADMLNMLAEDPSTRVVGAYIEGLECGRRFIEAADRITRQKPVIVMKSGRSESGARAASSHTGSIAGSDSVYEAAFTKSNVLRADDLDTFFDAINIFSRMPVISDDGIAIISNAGGLGVMAADACSEQGISLASLARSTVEELEESIPNIANPRNPIDLRGDASAEMFIKAMRIVSNDPAVNGLVLLSAPVDTVDLDAVAAAAVEFADGSIPIALSFPGGLECDKALEKVREGGLPDFPTPERAVGAMAMMLRYRQGLLRGPSNSLPMVDVDYKTARNVVDEVLAAGRDSLSEEEGKRILQAYGVPVPGEGKAQTCAEAVEMASKIGYPLVMKIISADIHHKTDIGGVIVGIRDAESVKESFNLLMERSRRSFPGAKIDGVSVQEMVKGEEVIVSMVRDETFGPVLSYGMGGIFVEILKEVSQRVLPLSLQEVDDLIRSNKAYQLLSGARGRSPGDIASLTDIMVRVARIATDIDEIEELEINPVMVGPMNEGSWAVDALVTLRRLER